MNQYIKKRASQILKCDPSEVPDNIKDIKIALREKKAQAVATREAAKGVKHG